MRPLLLLSLAAALFVIAPPARAGTYEVAGCDTGSVSGWASRASGAFNGFGATCGHRGGALTLHNLIGSPGAAEWRFAAPPDTDIAAFRLLRRSGLAGNRPWATMVHRVETAGGGDGYRADRPNLSPARIESGWAWEEAAGLTGQTSLAVTLECGGGLACAAPGGDAAVAATRVTLRDAVPPAITSVTPEGDEPLTGRTALAYRATDRGGGLLASELRVDGVRVAEAPVHANDGRCTRPFRHVVPCRLEGTGTLPLDTTRLANGAHTVELTVTDATGTNTAAWRRTITVANPAPSPPAPDPGVPGAPPSSSPPPSTTSACPVAAGAPLAPTACATVPGGARIVAWLERGRRRAAAATVQAGTRVRLRGRVTDREGRPVAGAALALRERVSGRRRWAEATGVVTRRDGRFTAFTRTGPSRTLRVTAGPARSRALRLAVRAAVRLRATRRGPGVAFRGRVAGRPHLPPGVRVDLQARLPTGWAAYARVRANRTGRYRGTATLPPGATALRARVPAQPGLPWAAGTSRPVRPAAPALLTSARHTAR